MKTIKELEKEKEKNRLVLQDVDFKKIDFKEFGKLNNYIEILALEREIQTLKDVRNRANAHFSNYCTCKVRGRDCMNELIKEITGEDALYGGQE
jgi:hypothetical protein